MHRPHRPGEVPAHGPRVRPFGQHAAHADGRGDLKVDGTTLSGKTLDGSTLTAGTSHMLTGKVTFSKGGTHLPVTATLKFTSCPNP